MTKLPQRMKMGQGIVGPDYYGCINSGKAPVISKDKHIAKYTNGEKQFAVGRMSGVSYYELFCAIINEDKAYFKCHGIRLFKTYKTEKKCFTKMIKEVELWNRRQAEKHHALKQKAAQSDVGAEWNLIDY
jgi:hypothetical protein